MPLFRRERSADPVADAFGRVAECLDTAQRLLLDAIPTPRDPGVPLAEALAQFEAGLDRAQALMPAWRTAATATIHDRCAEALRDARAEAERLRLAAEPLGFETLNARVGDVLHPLEEFADAERTLRGRGKEAGPSP